jgi:hypothetical protein
MGASKREGLRNIRTSFPHYRSRVASNRIDRTDYFEIIALFMRYLVRKIFEGNIVKLPEMGSMFIRGNRITPYIDEYGRQKGISVNFKATRDHRRENPGSKEVIYFTNEQTDHMSYSLRWCRAKMYEEHKNLYTFELSREHKRSSKRYITSKEIDYAVSSSPVQPKLLSTNDIHVYRPDTIQVSERLWIRSGEQ